MMDKIAVKPAVSILEWVYVDKAESENRRCDDRIDILGRTVVEGDQAINERGKVFVPSAEMVRQRHAAAPVVLSDKAAVRSQAQAHETGVADQDPLQAQEFGKIKRSSACLSYGSAPSLDTILGWVFAFDDVTRPGVLQKEERRRSGEQICGHFGGDRSRAFV